MQKTIIAASLILLSCTSTAGTIQERVFEQSNSQLHYACKAGEQIAIEGAGNTAIFTGACSSIRVEGANNLVQAAAIGHLDIEGAGNQVQAHSLTNLSLEGASNLVTWRNLKGKAPRILKNDGVDNLIQRATD